MLQESPLRKAGASWKNGTRDDDDDEGLRTKPPSLIPEDAEAAEVAEKRRSDRRPIMMNVEVVAILSIKGNCW